MARRLWFKLQEISIEFASLTDGVGRIRDLREKIVVRYLNRDVQDQVEFYASPTEQQVNRPLDLDTKVDGLGVELELPILVDAPLVFPPIRIVPHGLVLGAPRLERAQLLDKVHASLIDDRQRFVLLVAPEESGKSSILMLFAHQYAELYCIEVPFMIERGSPFNVFRKRCGLDICMKESSLSKIQQHVIMIDDAQDKYEDKAFWKALVTESPSWLPSNIRFIIAAAHALEG
ncbi:hypothetical protein PHYSODRAFT_322427 [Phytophthora sojae]|uniref:Uncharacterized protein n=1 Tax=Phytophthora sojae (strain P6497) TaxID=1094619 RepID=G4YIX8_PHYSP|nr:hypothetical protein PHYSODRAFT_322427 [Phytophthora sojae]EGZ28800.1 hypothetical protein PHYSODRAFT_322427 [Phytophthora sojae]|eukprot:XP_009516075.1 hypothetical protein PHYSODRAFT_322427 [Phytophthora sojae]